MRSKLQAHAFGHIFLGYSTAKKGYKCLDVKNQEIYYSWDVKISEGDLYFSKHEQDTLSKGEMDVMVTLLRSNR